MTYWTRTATLSDYAVPTTAALMPLLSLKFHSAAGETMHFSDSDDASDSVTQNAIKMAVTVQMLLSL